MSKSKKGKKPQIKPTVPQTITAQTTKLQPSIKKGWWALLSGDWRKISRSSRRIFRLISSIGPLVATYFYLRDNLELPKIEWSKEELLYSVQVPFREFSSTDFGYKPVEFETDRTYAKLLFTLAAAGPSGVDYPDYYINCLDSAREYFRIHPPTLPDRKIRKAFDFGFLIKNFGKGDAYRVNYNVYMKGSTDPRWFRIDSTWGKGGRFIPGTEYTVKHGHIFKDLNEPLDNMVYFQINLSYKPLDFDWCPYFHQTLRASYEYDRKEGPWVTIDDNDEAWPPLGSPIIWEMHTQPPRK